MGSICFTANACTNDLAKCSVSSSLTNAVIKSLLHATSPCRFRIALLRFFTKGWILSQLSEQDGKAVSVMGIGPAAVEYRWCSVSMSSIESAIL